MSGNPTPSSDSVVESPSPSPIPCEDSDSLVEETDTLLSYFNDSSPDYETFCFDIEEKSSGSTTTHSDYSLSDYEAFYFDDDHIKEKSSGSTTTHSNFSLPEYDSFIFDLSIDPFPPVDRSISHHEEFTDELAHIISPPDDPLIMTNPSEIDTLTLFPFGNENKFFNPGILTSKGFHYRHSLGLSHRDSEAFKINKKFKSPMEIFPFFCLYYGGDVSSLDVPIPFDLEDLRACFQSSNHAVSDHLHIPSGESKVHIEVLSALWGNRLPIRTVRARCLGPAVVWPSHVQSMEYRSPDHKPNKWRPIFIKVQLLTA
ncbi:hypothetical protein Tco_1049413 [Tanacetum coccineum]